MKSFGIRLNVALFVLVVGTSLSAKQVLNFANGSDPKDVDPHTVQGEPEFNLMQNLFEGLVSRDPVTVDPIPGVAEKWEVSKDGKKYTFTLRNNAKWSNGEPVKAEDFVYSMRRLVMPETASVYAYQGYCLKNGLAINNRKIKDITQLGVKAEGDFKLIVELEEPTPYFLRLLGHHSYFPVHKATVEKFKQRWTRPENIVSNGPFKMTKWELSKAIQMVKNPFYWDKDKVQLDEANALAIEQNDAEEKLFRAKQIDATMTVPTEKIDYWKKDKTGVFHSFPLLGTYGFKLNVSKKPLDDKRVRRALAFAIDRSRLVKYVTRGNQLPAIAWVPPTVGGTYKSDPALPIDGSRFAEAKKLLADAGYPGGKGFPTIEILYNTMESHKKIAETIQQMWKETLGIPVSLVNQEWKVFLDNTRKSNFWISRFGWNGDYNDPNTFMDMWTTGNPNNETTWSNKEYDRLIAAAAKELNHQKRYDLFRKAEGILMEDMPLIPFYYYTKNQLVQPWVKGWQGNVEDTLMLKYVSVPTKP